MVDFSYLFSLADFSLSDFIFGNDKNKKKNEIKTKNLIIQKKDERNNNNHLNIKKLSQKEKKLILKLEIEIDNFLYRKKVKSIIQKLKDNYKIDCSANIPDLSIKIYSSTKKKCKQYKLFYEPILKQNIVLLPRKIYRNKKKLKFNFINSKNEIFIEPKYKTENEDGSFINVLDLREIKEQEYKNYEDFELFLKKLHLVKKEKDKNENKYKEKVQEAEKFNLNEPLSLKYNYSADKNELYENNTNYVTDKEIIPSNEDLKSKKKLRKSSVPSLNKDYKKLLGINSILKERNSQRLKNPRKISFGEVEFSY